MDFSNTWWVVDSVRDSPILLSSLKKEVILSSGAKAEVDVTINDVFASCNPKNSLFRVVAKSTCNSNSSNLKFGRYMMQDHGGDDGRLPLRPKTAEKILNSKKSDSPKKFNANTK